MREKTDNNRNRGKKSENVKREKIVGGKLKMVSFSVVKQTKVSDETVVRVIQN